MKKALINLSLFAVFIAAFSFSAFAQTTQTVPAGGKITGRVTFGGDNSELHGTTLHIVQLKRTVSAGDDGNYEFTDVPPGRYSILAHLEGFADSLKTVTVLAGQSITIDFQLQITSLKAEVTVTASGTEQSTFDSFQSVNSVSSTQITTRAATSIGDVLDGETGVSKRSFGPGTSRPVVRGFDGDRVLVLQDGVRAGSVGYASGDHSEPIDPLSAERIEVVKGPATLLYGSSAIGGVVNAVSSDDNEKHEGARGYFSAIGGTADKQGALSGGGEYGYKHWLFRGSASAQRNGDYSTPIGKVPNSAGRSNSFSVSPGYYGDKFYFNGAYTYDVRRYGIPFAALFHEHHEEPVEERGVIPVVDEDVDIRMRRHNYRLKGGFHDLNSFISGGQFFFDYTNYRHTELEIHSHEDGELHEEVGTVFDNKTYSYRGLFEQKNYEKLTGRFGFEGFNRNYNVVGEEALVDGRVRHNSFSAFTLQELNFNRFKFQFGGRVENNRYRPDSIELFDRSFTGFSGAAGIFVNLWEGGAFVANYTNSYRAPSLDELYNDGPHIGNITFEVGDANLRRERSNGIDFSVRHTAKRFRFHGDVYYYHINDFVFLAPQDLDDDGVIDIEDGLPLAHYEQANSRFIGAELSADVTLHKYVGLFVSGDLVNAKLTASDAPLVRIPPARFRTGLDFNYKGFNVRPEAVFVADQNKIFPLETRTAGYGLFNLSASYVIGKKHFAHIFTFNGYNLTDRLYRNHLSFVKDLMPEIGRGARFGYTLRFF